MRRRVYEVDMEGAVRDVVWDEAETHLTHTNRKGARGGDEKG